MARPKAAKVRAAPKGNVPEPGASDLNASDGRGGYARNRARKAAVKKAFGILTRKR